MAYYKYYTSIYLVGLSKTVKNLVKIAGDPADIRTEYIPNTFPAYYPLTNHVGRW